MPRSVLNRAYEALGEKGKARFYERYSKIFRDTDIEADGGLWTVKFCGRDIKLPLRPESFWLDWDNALSIVGHDLEIKQTYAAILTANPRPAFFIDVGANYGMHSVLFLDAQVPTLTFEPNPHCRSCFQTVCELNALSGRWEPFAIGDRYGEVELIYPEKETWLGSVASEIVPSLMRDKSVIKDVAEMKRLDDYFSEIPLGNIILKIDVEGFELEVLRGASRILSFCKPKIIFESIDGRVRLHLYRAFEQFGYALYSLPWRPSIGSKRLEADEFLVNPAHNFIGIACDQVTC